MSIAAAKRFLIDHNGYTFLTVQVSRRGTWEPGPRRLVVSGSSFWFDTSQFRFEPGMKCLELTDHSVKIAYPEVWGMEVTYSLV